MNDITNINWNEIADVVYDKLPHISYDTMVDIFKKKPFYSNFDYEWKGLDEFVSNEGMTLITLSQSCLEISIPFNVVKEFLKLYDENDFTVEEAAWLGNYKKCREPKFSLTNESDIWGDLTSYERCHSILVKFGERHSMTVYFFVWQGDVNGKKTNRRCYYKINVKYPSKVWLLVVKCLTPHAKTLLTEELIRNYKQQLINDVATKIITSNDIYNINSK